MTAYSIALFLHIVGALGFFAALGLEWASAMQLRRVTNAEQVRVLLETASRLKRITMISMVVLLLAGIYMMATVWGGPAWLIIAFVAIVLLMVVMGRVTNPRLKAIQALAATEKSGFSPQLQAALRQPSLWMGVQVRIAIGLGIVFLMTVKPDLLGSVLTVVISILLGLATALPLFNRMPVNTMEKAS